MVGKGFFFNWQEDVTAGVEAVGGKGWNLARLERYGFTVPVGGDRRALVSNGDYLSFIDAPVSDQRQD